MRLFGYDITIRKYRPPIVYTPPVPDTLTMQEVESLRKRLEPAAPLPNGASARCYPIRRGGLSVAMLGEHDNIGASSHGFVSATVRPFRSLDTLGWVWALDNPVEGTPIA